MIRVIAETEQEADMLLLAIQDGSLAVALGGKAIAGWYGADKVGCLAAAAPAAPMGRHRHHDGGQEEP